MLLTPEDSNLLCASPTKNCRVTICARCTVAYSSHALQHVSQRYSDVRKTIFERLSHLDGISKPLKHNEFIVKRASDKIGYLHSSLGPEKETQTLVEVYQRVITENTQEWRRCSSDKFPGNILEPEKMLLRYIQSLTLQANQCSEELRSLLQMSNTTCIDEIVNPEKLFLELLLKQRKELECHPCMDWKINLETAVYQAVRSVLNSFSIPSIKNISITKLQLNFAELEVVNKNVENENVILSTTSKSGFFYIGKRELFGVTFHKEKTDRQISKIIKEKERTSGFLRT